MSVHEKTNFATNAEIGVKWIELSEYTTPYMEKIRSMICNNAQLQECKLVRKNDAIIIHYPVSCIGHDVHVKWHDDSKTSGKFYLLSAAYHKSVRFTINGDVLKCY